MIKVLFCIFSVMMGIIALFLGVDSLTGFDWRIESALTKYTDPVFISKKESVNNVFDGDLDLNDTSLFIDCYTYDNFLNAVEKYQERNELNVMVNKANAISEGIVTSATAKAPGIQIHYEPSLLIVLNGYGNDELILEMEREKDQRFLRLVVPNAQHSTTTAKTLRQMDLPYALNRMGISEEKLEQAKQSVYYPRYALEVSGPTAQFSNELSADELQLKMKGLIYDALIRSYEKGWEQVVFEATIKNLKALQTVLDEMMPLPIQLVSYPYWRDEE